MNQTDYKAIADIIRKQTESLSRNGKRLWNYLELISQLADYFEQEDKKNQPTKDVWNKQQFLKDCGVDG